MRGYTTNEETGPLSIQQAVDVTPTPEQETRGFALTKQDGSSRGIGMSESHAAKANRPHMRPPHGARLSDASTYQERYAVTRHVELATLATHAIALAAKGDDLDRRSVAVAGLKQHLRALWKLRKSQSDEWAEIVNLLQGALTQITPELISSQQADALADAIRTHLAMGGVADHQPRQVRSILRRGGIDPWAPLQLLEAKAAPEQQE